MTLKEFLSVLNIRVKYRVFDKFSRNEIELKPYREDKDTYSRTIYMVYQENNGTLDIHLF